MASNEMKEGQAALADSEVSHAQFRALANSIPNLAWMADPDGWVFWYNQRWYDYTGTTPEEMVGWGWQAVHDPDVLPEMLKRWTKALRKGEAFEMTFPLRRGSDGSFRMFVTRAEPLRENGQVVGWFGTNTDITEQERTRERLQLVINELNHRVKNTLAAVHSIAANSFRHSSEKDYETFEKRLIALSAVHDLLTRDGWAKTSVREAIEIATSMFEASRFDIGGEELEIEPRLASALAMTLHELSTNAAKYGALSVDEGRVEISWTSERVGERKFLVFRRIETGGPPVQDPERAGFGVKLIKRATATESGASVKHEFLREGVRCAIRVPIDAGFVR